MECLSRRVLLGGHRDVWLCLKLRLLFCDCGMQTRANAARMFAPHKQARSGQSIHAIYLLLYLLAFPPSPGHCNGQLPAR